ncbi:MAG: Fic family protein [Nanoarchaeota archaeon]|nr:Fic family protein [Nanoarchaeota archaeon]MBU1946522.1 Fic family protein [Nanoarchaeota archaeon]
MVFIRTKKIGKYRYKYLVKTVYKNRKPKQEVIKYMGKEDLTKIKPNLSKEDIIKLDKIKDNFLSEKKRIPRLVFDKNLKNFLVKYTYNTNAIEGSALTLRETSLILQDKIAPKGRSLTEIREAENHAKAFEFMYRYKGELDKEFILKLHKILMGDVNDEFAGKIRGFNVAISGVVFKPPQFEALSYELKNFFKWYSANKKKLPPFELASLVHLKFVTIHPFGDGNGRISRLLMNFILKNKEFPMVDIPYVDRQDYYESLEDCQINKIEKPFVDYLNKEYLKEYKEYS